ncbi:MAG: transposase [Vulcanimicrobiaceae bacterium]
MAAKQEMKALYHCVFNLHLHLVLITKYRRRCIDAAILARLHGIFTRLAERWGCELLEFNGEVAPSVLVNNFNTVSSRLIRLLEPLVVHR